MNSDNGKDLVKTSIELFPKQCRQAWEDSHKIKINFDFETINNVVVCGMGGSRFPPKTIQYLFEDRIKVPYLVNDTYTLPGFVDAGSLVILSSYSGGTEEVLSCFKEAVVRGAKTAVISAGGRLKELAGANNIPSYIFDPIYNPSGQPRLGVGYMLMGHLGLLRAFRLLDIFDDEVNKSLDFLDTVAGRGFEKYETLASAVKERVPVIVVSEHLRGFANGFANQINENAKSYSDFRIISELNHHLMEGLGKPDIFKKEIVFVFLKSRLYSPIIKKRFDLTEEVVAKQGVETYSYELTGKTGLEQVLEGFTLSGFTTYYLSKLYGVDAIKIPWVDYFKERLR